MEKLIVLENIRTLSKVKKIPMQDVEKAGGVSVGYFSRLISDIAAYRETKPADKTERPLPPTEVLYNVAVKLGITLDQLMNVNFKDLGDPEIAMLCFLGNLRAATERNELIWKAESFRTIMDTETFCFMKDFPLRKLAKYRTIDPDTLQKEEKETMAFYSLFANSPCYLQDDLMRLEYNGRTLLLARVAVPEDYAEDESPCITQYELYSVVSSKMNKILYIQESRSSLYSSPLETAIKQLFYATQKSVKFNPTGDNVVNIINDYMKHFGFDK